MDKKIANDVLDYFLANIVVGGNIVMFNILDEVLKNIEKEYSILLK